MDFFKQIIKLTIIHQQSQPTSFI